MEGSPMQSDSTDNSLRRRFDKAAYDRRYREEHRHEINAARRRRMRESVERRQRKAEQDRRYREQHRQAIASRRQERCRKYAARYRKEHADKVKAAISKWRANHREHEQKYRKEHKEAARERKRRYNEKGGDKRYWAENKHRFREKRQKYYLEHRDEIRVKLKRYYESHPELFRAYGRNRRARMRSVSGSHTAADILTIWERQKHKCAIKYCKFPISEKGKDKYHVDHVKAIINGGSNDPSNLQILCRHHNTAKQGRDEYLWAQQNGLLFV